MQHTDTCQLLKECNSGIKMAVDAIQEVLPNVKNGPPANRPTENWATKPTRFFWKTTRLTRSRA